MKRKTREQREQELAAIKASDLAESEKRRERIKVLWAAITSGELAQDAKDLADNELVRSLTELAQKQKCEIEYLTQFRRDLELIRDYYPEQLRELSSASQNAVVWPAIKSYNEKQRAGRTPRQNWERDNRRSLIAEYYSIEYQFGGKEEAAWRKSSFSGHSGEPYEPTCFRKIITGVPINMRELQNLFWPLRRDRFPKDVLRDHRIPEGRKVFYRPPVVPAMMKALLSEESAKPQRAQGKARRIWLSDPDLRIRVLSGIDAYLKSLASELWEASPDRAEEWQEWETKVANPILDVLRPYLSDSAE